LGPERRGVALKHVEAGVKRALIARHYLDALDLPALPPALPYLNDLIQRHIARLPFCSIGPRLGLDLPLELPALFDRIVEQRRGGYCFEHNGLFFAMLAELGFDVQLLLARVIYNRNVHPGLTHRITLVKVRAERYIADVGFGPMGPRGAVGMSGEPEVRGGQSYRVHEAQNGEWHVQLMKDSDWFSLYRFELLRYGEADCELGHFFSHRHPDAVFVNNLVASRILDGEVRSLRNREYRVLRPAGDQAQPIGSPQQLHAILSKEFDLAVTAAESRILFEKLA
jgi:N-hydroxyarylamine O-acetyltransferase